MSDRITPMSMFDYDARPVTPGVVLVGTRASRGAYAIRALLGRKDGPLVLRQRTVDRGVNARVASLTPVWRGCEFQEREVFDLFGVVFDGHPDLRRILMWDGYQDYPMRKDYVAPDDYEYEPTPHDEVLARAKQHQRPAEAKA